MRINAVDLRQLRYFVHVAEELHFGRAAKRLNISQPPLSQQIKALENFLGVMLFRRTQRKVELTAAGKYLLPEAQRILQDMARVAEQTKKAEVGLTGRLRIGMNFSAPLHPFTSKLLQKFHKLYPHVRMELVLHEKSEPLQRTDMQGAQLDLALMWLEVGHLKGGIMKLDLAHDPLQAAVSSGHPLARKTRIHIRDLVGEPFITQTRLTNAQRYEGIIKAFASIKSHPRIMHEAGGLQFIMSMIAAGQGVSLMPSFLGRLGIEGVVLRPLVLPGGRKPPCMTYHLVGSASNLNPAAAIFFDVARSLGAS
jgi:DNA-binding transcriptional LysR family regulator